MGVVMTAIIQEKRDNQENMRGELGTSWSRKNLGYNHNDLYVQERMIRLRE